MQTAGMTSDGHVKFSKSGFDWSMHRRRASSTQSIDWSRRRKASPTQSIDFGGSLHTTDSQGRLVRPEFAKSEVCKDTKCEDCTSITGSGCWNGASSGVYDWMQVNVDANDPKDTYALEVFASCSSSTGSWIVRPKEIVNAYVKVYVDGALQKTLQDADSNCASNCETNFGKSGSTVTLNIASGQKARIRIVLQPKKSGSVARAKMAIQANSIDSGVDECMSTKVCLSVLGDNSADSYELRNSNLKQRDCLSGTWQSAKCTEWKNCLPADQEEKLLAFLKASLRAPALEEVGMAKRSHKTKEVTCMDPSSTDPESWECECVDMIVEKCGGVDETCFFNTMCAHADICSEWKTANECPGALEQNAAAIKRTTRSANISLLDTGLDNALQGKCAEQ